MADTLITADLQSVRNPPDPSTPAGPGATDAQDLSEYAFRRMRYVEPASSQRRDAASAVILDIHYPRISNPETPAIARFNSILEQAPRFRRDELTNEVVDYEIVYAGKSLVSVRFARCFDTIGAAHPWGASGGTTVLMDAGRLLEADDVFNFSTEWQDFVAARAVDEITRQFPEHQLSLSAADVRETAVNVNQWLITENALILLFPVLSFGAPYVAGGAEVAIPWADLALYLREDAPAPIVAAGVREREAVGGV